MSVVMKFGGTSVADPDAISRLIGVVSRELSGDRGPRISGAPTVVVSALSKVTDTLVKVCGLAEDGNGSGAAQALDALVERHVSIASAVTTESRASVVASVKAEFDELIGLVHALAVLREVSPRSQDAVLSVGEIVSSRIVAAALADSGIASAWVDARTVLITDAEYTSAAPDMTATCDRVREHLAPVQAAGKVAVLGGFIGATASGVTTTLGRGGSDYSAAIFGACLGVGEIQIWTDVDGMLTADPRVVPHPRLVEQLSFHEASELAFFGAKVLHPSTILPAVDKNIPVRILNSRRPENTGTRITAEGRPDATGATGLTALACKRDVTVVDITSTRMLMAHGFLRRLFEVFERFKTPVDVVTTSEVSVSVTVDDTRRLDDIVEGLRHFAEVSSERDMAIICAVGENLRSDPAAFARAVNALDRVPLRLVSQAASRRNITFVLRNADVPEAMTRLHDQFFGRD
ncbi:MAG: lysine-sensitive aspartokinase 3 [Acidobacteria bacterium]|nr:lysine-sensitive aspartokinase 3 [Acidobacteriota bacterium]